MIGLLGTGAILTSSIIGASVILPTATSWLDSDNQGEDLARAATVVAEKADDLNSSFLDITPIRIPDESPAPRLGESRSRPESGYGPGPGPESRFGPGPGSMYGSGPGPGYGSGSGPMMPRNQYISISGHDNAVAPAFETLAVIDSGVGSPFDNPVQARITAMENLQAAWAPRYRQSKSEYERLVLRVEHTDRAAREYFEYQKELTTQIYNPRDRERSQLADQKDLQLYQEWREQARETVEHASMIMRDLNDMDIMITKQALSANFAAVYIDVQRVPSAIIDFHQELGEFRLKLDEINTQFNNDNAPTVDDWMRENQSWTTN